MKKRTGIILGAVGCVVIAVVAVVCVLVFGGEKTYVVQSLLEGRSLTQANRLYNGFVCGVIVLLLTLLMTGLRLWINGVITAAAIAGQVGLCLWLDGSGLVLNMAILPLGMIVGLVWSVAAKYAAEALQK